VFRPFISFGLLGLGVASIALTPALTGQAAHGTPVVSGAKPTAAKPAKPGEKSPSLAERLVQAPPDIEAALRKRVSNFYQALVDGNPREAENMMVKESAEIFYKMDKPKYMAYRINGIKYDAKFQEADVLLALDMVIVNPRMGRVNAPVLTSANWVLRDGEWRFRYKQVGERDSPFGVMKPGPNPEGGDAFQQKKGVNPEDLLKQIKLSKREFTLSTEQPSSDFVVIENGMPGDIELDLALTEVGDTKFSLDKTKLKQGESAKLTVRCDPQSTGARNPLAFNFEVKPLGIRYQMQVEFTVPASAAPPTKPPAGKPPVK
jgi:hypothetical protein